MSRAAKFLVPAGACDCHMHVYEDRFPLVPQATFKPPHAPLADYRAVQRALGLSRVAIVPTDVADAELQRLTHAGVRGIRYFLLPGGLLSWESLEPMATRVARFGWHVQLQLDGRELPRYESVLSRLPVPLVIDHNGKFLEPVATDHPGFLALLRLLAGGNTWVKLSAPYETSKVGPPRYEDVSALAKALVAARPDRCVWASNWPHPNRNPPPDTGELLDLLAEWAPDEATRDRILVGNPAQLYGFHPARIP